MIPTPRFPPLGPLRRCVPQVPRYYQDAVTPWCPSRSASFPSRSRYHGSTRPSVRSRRRRARFLRRTWSLFTRLLRPGIVLVEAPGPPKFPWSLLCPFAMFTRPRPDEGLRPLTGTRAAPARSTTKAPTTVLSRLSCMASELAVYASRCQLPEHHARLAPGCWSGFTGRDSHPQRLR